jgi:hypothetical protein
MITKLESEAVVILPFNKEANSYSSSLPAAAERKGALFGRAQLLMSRPLGIG